MRQNRNCTLSPAIESGLHAGCSFVLMKRIHSMGIANSVRMRVFRLFP